MVFSSSRFVTVRDGLVPLDDRAIGARALEDRNRRLNELLWYALEAVEVTRGIRSRTESALPSLECLLAAPAPDLGPSAIVEVREWAGLATLSLFRKTFLDFRLSTSPPE